MPRNDDATRRTARERSQARMSHADGSRSRAPSRSSYERSRQQRPSDRSRSRYSRQAPNQTSQSSRTLESSRRRTRFDDNPRNSRSQRPQRSTRDSYQGGGSERRASRGGERQAFRSGQNERGRTDRHRQTRSRTSWGSSILEKLPSPALRIGVAAVGAIALLFLVFGVIVPSCSRTAEPAGDSSASSAAATTQGIVHSIGQRAASMKSSVETANQVGALETSNAKVQALVTLLGEEETAKLIAQVKTNPDALWIAAHPDAFAFDGVEIQYKILKLAADEPASISYVREFPAKYPMANPDTDKSLAMDVASPSNTVPNTPIPHLYQWDRRWAYIVYSSATFGLTGCGPTSLAMVYQGLNRTVDRTPFDMAVLAEERGYMSEFNGTDSSFFLDVAPDLGLSCWEAYPDAATIRDELSKGHAIITNLGPGYFTTNGHFFVLAGLTDDGQVIVNDPYSVVRSSQTWDADFIASESMAMFVYAKA